jgi:hypothetical protein
MDGATHQLAKRRERPGSVALMRLPLGREQSGSIRLSRMTRTVMPILNLAKGEDYGDL